MIVSKVNFRGAGNCSFYSQQDKMSPIDAKVLIDEKTSSPVGFHSPILERDGVFITSSPSRFYRRGK